MQRAEEFNDPRYRNPDYFFFRGGEVSNEVLEDLVTFLNRHCLCVDVWITRVIWEDSQGAPHRLNAHAYGGAKAKCFVVNNRGDIRFGRYEW